MKNNNATTFIIIVGVIVLTVFSTVAIINVIPNIKESNSYYVKVEDGMSAKIEGMQVNGNKLVITTSGDAKEICVKSTKSTPENNSICWKSIENNLATITIYQYKRYFVWVKDTNGNISSPMSINAND